MELITTASEFESLPARSFALLKCQRCGKTFRLRKNRIMTAQKKSGRTRAVFCSVQCHNATKKRSTVVRCETCGKSVVKQASESRRTKHSFCSRSCSAKYRNANKTFGVRKSRAEKVLLKLIRADWPKLKISENDRTLVPGGLEVDLYIPSARLAIEVNGPLHYRPIFGEAKFKRIVKADKTKRKHLAARGIAVMTLDVSLGRTPAKVLRIVTDGYRKRVKPQIQKRQGPN